MINKAIAISILIIINLLIDCSTYAGDSTCGGYSDTQLCCNEHNPYPCSNDQCGNCTWWAWYMACEKWCKALPDWGNAVNWYDSAKFPFEKGDNPKENSIVVANWGGKIDGVYKNWGHVAWISKVHDDGSFDTIEMSWVGWKDGTCGIKSFKNNTKDKMHSTGTSVVGFISFTCDGCPPLPPSDLRIIY